MCVESYSHNMPLSMSIHKTRKHSSAIRYLFETQSLFTKHQKKRFHDNVMLLLNEDQLLTANHSGLFSGAFLDRNVSPCVKYIPMVSCCQTWGWKRHKMTSDIIRLWWKHVQLFWFSNHLPYFSCLTLTKHDSIVYCLSRVCFLSPDSELNMEKHR